MPSIIQHDGHYSAVSSPTSTRKPSIQQLSKNIETVVLGNVLFEAWYYSPYQDSIILSTESYDNGATDGACSAPSPSNASSSSVTCARLHVCPYCFRYTPHLSPYISHLRHHRYLQKQDPDTPPVPKSSTKVYEHDGYAVWEIDGENEKIYCQNLSLFGKLFLEQKSVFFDTGGFLYYVLTYTPPVPPAKKTTGRRGHVRNLSNAADDLGLDTQVLGFFSKENPSWDSNNLACILIFPPFQHRQLGKLLMSVSYKLSGWEWEGGVIGGPEKPLSLMGRRSYLRFWAKRVARFLLGQSADADGKRIFDKGRKMKLGPMKEEMTVKEIGDRTGMLAEDVVAALVEMGVCELVPPRKRKKKIEETNGIHPEEVEVEPLVNMVVKVSDVRRWAEKNRIDLQDPVHEEGFLGEWAMSDPGEVAEQDMAVSEEEEEDDDE
jgi:hypothetical protein